MIDVHHHCLPGVDDGPRDLAEAADLCRMAADEGIETIIATPHVLRGRWREYSPAELQSRLDALRAAVGDTPQLVLGSEYFFAHDMAEVMEGRKSVIPLAGSRYVLVEFTANNVPPVEQTFYRLQLAGWTPIVAHPERNIVLQSKPELVVAMIEHGARMQVTAGSLTGEFGSSAQRAAETWIRSGLVHFIATDAHNTNKRAPRPRAAIAIVRELAGEQVAEALSVGNPRAVLRNDGLPYEPDPALIKDGGLIARLRSFFRTQ